MRIRIVLSALVIAMVGWAGCRNLPTSPEAKDVLNTLSVSPDSTPQLQSLFIYWTDVAWGFVERWRDWRCGVESLIPFRYKYRYRYWLTIRTEDYEPNWPPEMIVNGDRIFKDANSILDWYIRGYVQDDYINVSDRDDANVRIDTIIGGNPDHRIMWTGYVFESCKLDYYVSVRIGRTRYSIRTGRLIHYIETPPHTVRVRPLW